MPDLPTITVTDEQSTRCIAAWGSVSAYREWLRAQVIAYVRATERAAATADLTAAYTARLDTIDTTDPA